VYPGTPAARVSSDAVKTSSVQHAVRVGSCQLYHVVLAPKLRWMEGYNDMCPSNADVLHFSVPAGLGSGQYHITNWRPSRINWKTECLAQPIVALALMALVRAEADVRLGEMILCHARLRTNFDKQQRTSELHLGAPPIRNLYRTTTLHNATQCRLTLGKRENTEAMSAPGM
jgi:hypothetical protein